MKKILSLILAIALVASMGVTAFATTIEAKGDEQTHDVQAKYTGGIETPEVYSVDIAWGAMQFTYNASGTMDWDASKHEYVNNTAASWTASGNTVKVTNHSNASVTAAFAYAPETAYSAVTGSFDVVTETLDAGVVGGYDTADSVTATLTLGGELADTVTDYTKVGTITVTIS